MSYTDVVRQKLENAIESFGSVREKLGHAYDSLSRTAEAVDDDDLRDAVYEAEEGYERIGRAMKKIEVVLADDDDDDYDDDDEEDE